MAKETNAEEGDSKVLAIHILGFNTQASLGISFIPSLL